MYPKLNFIIVAPGIAEMINLYQPLMAEFGVQEVGSLEAVDETIPPDESR